MNSLPAAILDHACDPQNRRTMKEPSVIGRANLGGRPPEIVIYLKVTEGMVSDASFEASGCGYTIACCSVLTELVKEKTVEDCKAVSAIDIFGEIGELPKEKQFCATLAVEALQDALGKVGAAPGSAGGEPS